MSAYKYMNSRFKSTFFLHDVLGMYIVVVSENSDELFDGLNLDLFFLFNPTPPFRVSLEGLCVKTNHLCIYKHSSCGTCAAAALTAVCGCIWLMAIVFRWCEAPQRFAMGCAIVKKEKKKKNTTEEIRRGWFMTFHLFFLINFSFLFFR
jgi:hypothetical protein